jgi:hypothetical protein
MYTARQWLILEILCALSAVSFIACVTATYYNPDILNKGLWVLLLFAILCNLYIGNALERVCRGELWKRARLTTQRQGSWRKRRGQQHALGPTLAEVEGKLARGFEPLYSRAF